MNKWLCGWLPAVVSMFALLLGAGAALRADQPVVQSPSGKQAKSDLKEASDDETEKAVLAFVAEHQPQLAELLNFMKKKKSKDYNEAMRESHKVRDRLLSIKDRDPEMYSVELAIWKNAAEIRLLAASVSVKSNRLGPEERTRLEELIKRENELNIQRLNLEKARIESRLSQLNQQISRRQEQADAVIGKSLKTWENRIERSGAKPKKKETPAR